MSKWSIFIPLLFFVLIANGQNCQTFDRSLFNNLQGGIPELINCTDSNGVKQGWWIYYAEQYNRVEKPDELGVGKYVDSYTCGRYINGKKVGKWESINNVHFIYKTRVDSFYYSVDTTYIYSDFLKAGRNKSSCYFTNDSSNFHYTQLYQEEEYPMKIDCNKDLREGEECSVFYRNVKIKTFPIGIVGLIIDFLNNEYEREKRLIDEQKDAN